MTSPRHTYLHDTRAALGAIAADRRLLLTVVVSALGYLVDVFDLILFSIVRVKSLGDIGVPADQILSTGVLLINMQMGGLLLGGFIWGVLGDKLGRLRVLFASILLYSLATLANAFVQDVWSYAALRLIGGIGLAGELGLCVTLVSELMPKQARGMGTTVIAVVGISGAIFAVAVSKIFDWRTAYIIGGVMGLLLLAARMRLSESALFQKTCDSIAGGRRGDILRLFGSIRSVKKYLCLALTAAPVWAVAGIIVTFAPEIARALGVNGAVNAAEAVLAFYIGLISGDIGAGIASQEIKSRKRVVRGFLLSMLPVIVLFAVWPPVSPFGYYVYCTLTGAGVGFWALFNQMAAENFGTDLRATATASLPNVVRGLTIPLTLGFKAMTPALGTGMAAVTTLAIAVVIALIALSHVQDTYHTDLDFIEQT